MKLEVILFVLLEFQSLCLYMYISKLEKQISILKFLIDLQKVKDDFNDMRFKVIEEILNLKEEENNNKEEQ